MSVHEATPKNLRVFGLGLGLILSAFALLSWSRSGAAVPYLLTPAVIFAALGAWAPMALAPVYRPWMRVVGVIGAVNAFLLMGFVFYCVITPYALVLRLLGKDILDLRFSDGSYWRAKPPSEGAASYTRQF